MTRSARDVGEAGGRITCETQNAQTSCESRVGEPTERIKKRKQRDRETTAERSEKSTTKEKVEESPSQKKRNVQSMSLGHRADAPLKGKVVVISTLTDGSHDKHNYKYVVSLCEQAGARISGQVHQRVACVVATPEAAGRGLHSPTQRVRKAWKRRIPVVGVQWIQDCIDGRTFLPLNSKYLLFEQTSETSKSSVSPSKNSNYSTVVDLKSSIKEFDDNDGEALLDEKHFDLGCCCVCHDIGEKECEWCVDCSVNKASVVAAAS